jgi:hypothetical protein
MVPATIMIDCCLDSPTPRQTAPYVALSGSQARIVAEASPQWGQVGRVCRVFWRDGLPWVLLRCASGIMVAIPWSWTTLPRPWSSHPAAPDDPAPPLLSPAALLDLVRFVRQRAGSPSTADIPVRRDP